MSVARTPGLHWSVNSLSRPRATRRIVLLWSWTVALTIGLIGPSFGAGIWQLVTRSRLIGLEPEEIHGISYFPKVAVEYRLNDGKEEKENWTPGTDKTSASFSKGSFEKMLRAQTVQLTADDNHGLHVVMQFDMPDPTPVEQACDIHGD
jgi:hypothetical protein